MHEKTVPLFAPAVHERDEAARQLRGDPVGFVVAVAVFRRSGQQLAAQGFTAGEIVFQSIEQDFGRKLP